MDTIFQGYPPSVNNFQFNHHSISPVIIYEEDTLEEGDFSDAELKYINQMLMEEDDLENQPCMFQDCMALQAAEKSFYDVLGEKYPPSTNQHHQFLAQNGSPGDDFHRSCSSHSSNSSSDANNFVESIWSGDQDDCDSSLVQSSHVNYSFESISQSNLPSFDSPNSILCVVNGLQDSSANHFRVLDSSSQHQIDLQKVTPFLPNDNHFNYDPEPKEKISRVVAGNERDYSPDSSIGKKNRDREDSDDLEEGRSNKQLAGYAEEYVESDMYDKVLLCSVLNPGLHVKPVLQPSDEASKNGAKNKLEQNGQSTKGSNRGRPRGKKKGNSKEVVDLRSLLTQCAQAVSSYDSRTAYEVLNRIRQHSSPYGDATERLAHYFANALEARLAGTGTELYTAFRTRRISAADILKAYHVFVSSCPFKKLSNIFANKSIEKLATGASTLHIIDFGILYGFQWPCLIQSLSVRPGGPPRLRITGIDLPQPGLRPAERVGETGRRLENYCRRFNVPFEYNAIAKKWETIQLKELNIDRDEVLIVNCSYRLGNVPDETVVADSPRDIVLNLIKRINPDMFIHGVTNGTYNAPFFVTRFREALFHFSAMFDIFEATVPREDQDRMLFEQEIIGRDAMNVIACEGTERVERPETYKQWQVRIKRAGLKQLPLDREIVNCLRDKLKSRYHKDFVVDEDGKWMLQAWKGRVIHALSCWKPVRK